jgi:hypothetical protein
VRCRGTPCGPWHGRGGVVAEVAQEPGAQDSAQSRQAGEDLSRRVLAKMLGHHLPKGIDLGVEGGDERDLGAHRGRVAAWWRLPELVGAKNRHDLVGTRLGVPATRPGQRRQKPCHASAVQRCRDPERRPGPPVRRWRPAPKRPAAQQERTPAASTAASARAGCVPTPGAGVCGRQA